MTFIASTEQRAAYDIVSFDTAPGDVILNHLRTVHAAPGNLTDGRRRAVAFRYAGDDARYVVRKKGSRPIHHPGLAPGDPLPCDIFPVVWPPAEAAIPKWPAIAGPQS